MREIWERDGGQGNTYNNGQENMLEDEDEMKNLKTLVSPSPGRGIIYSPQNHSMNSPGNQSMNTIGSRATKIPTQQDYLGTIKKKIGLGEQNSKVFNRFGQGSNTRDFKEVMYMQPSLFLLDTDQFLEGIQD
jgi:hypothetical protein